MTEYKKDPDAKLDYTFDWGQYLSPISDTIQTATFTADSPLTISNTSNTPTTATCFVSGGIPGQNLILKSHIVTVGGRIDDRSISLKIVNR